MRDNSAALKASPWFHIEQGKGNAWGVITTPSVSTFFDLVATHAQTSNERSWGTSADWIGLDSQSVEDFYKTRQSSAALKLVRDTLAKLPAVHSKFASPRAAITGGVWDTPSVLANIPLAARTRNRTKLAPLNIRLACFWSGGISASRLAPYMAKLVRAIYDYTMAGGVVNLRVGFISDVRDSDGRYSQACVETKVNCSDLAALASILAPCGFRALGGRLLTALCDGANNPTRGFNTDESLPGAIFINGCLEDVFKSLDAVIASLKIV